MNQPKINFEESKVVQKILNRQEFQINLDFLDNIFKNKTILILGASGSIAYSTILLIQKRSFHEMILVDKDENGLTKLSRSIELHKKKKTTFLCFDINYPPTSFFDRIKNKNLIILNFAALKHVRSETYKESLEYMFMTNCISPFIIFDKLIKRNQISIFFSISTDKSNLPVNYMGASKRLTEYILHIYSKKYPNTFISSTRFANVLFSNGSLTDSIVNKIYNGEQFGIPEKSKRYFISKYESAQIVLASLNNEFKSYISIPVIKIIGKPISFKDITKRIFKLYNIDPVFEKYSSKFINNKTFNKNKKSIKIFLTKMTRGEKVSESFKAVHEKSYDTQYIELKKIKLPKPNKKLDYSTYQEIIKNEKKFKKILKIINEMKEFKHNNKKETLFEIF